MKTFKTMLISEIKLSLRGMDMFIFAICMPVVMTIIIGIIYGNAPAYEQAPYSFLEQSFGAMSTISIGAGGLMGLPLVVSDYRHRKILKRYQVTPASPQLILVVQVVIYMLYSLTALLLIWIVSTLFFEFHFYGSIAPFMASFLLVMLSMFSIGMMVGGISANAKIASVTASLLYFPTLIFSGATLPYEMMPKTLQTVSDFLPLTQGIKLLKAISLNLPIDDIILPLIVMISLIIICSTIAIRFFKWE